MKIIILAGILTVLFCSSAVWADETEIQTSQLDDAANQPTKIKNAASADATESATVTQKAEDGSNSADNAEFVDKDGDGINDGKENRFRRKSNRQQHQDKRRMMQKKKQSGKTRSENNQRNN